MLDQEHLRLLAEAVNANLRFWDAMLAFENATGLELDSSDLETHAAEYGVPDATPDSVTPLYEQLVADQIRGDDASDD